jgi:tetratricopeptide (TPR) repeat protein
MMNKDKQISKLLPIVIIVILTIVVGLLLNQKNFVAKKKTVITAGLSDSQEKHFQQELSSAFKVSNLLDRGEKLLAQGDYDGAISNFKQALSASKMTGEKGMSMEYIADVYEKKRDYLLARDWMIKVRDNCPNEWALQPFVDRIQYLDYALKGEYELAVQQASKAVEDYKLTGTAQTESYIGRLNDLKAAKDYILNLKKK